MKVFADGRGYTLKEGAFHDSTPGAASDVGMKELSFIRDNKGAATQAVLYLDVFNCGGSCAGTGFVQVYAIQDGALKLKQEIRFILDADGTGARIKNQGRQLDIICRTDDQSPDCCPEHLDHATYSWNGQAFQLTDWKTLPYSKRK